MGSPALHSRVTARVQAIEQHHRDQPFPLYAHAQMLGDRERLRVFRSAIKHAVRPAGHVIEIGCGTGILAWYAAQQVGFDPAAKCFAVRWREDSRERT